MRTLVDDVATLSKENDNYIITPKNKKSAKIEIWLSDDGEHIGFSAGHHSWWPDNAPLHKDEILAILSAIANGNLIERERSFAGKVLAARGVITLKSGYQYTYGQINPLFLIPNILWSWQSRHFDAY